MGEEQLVTHGVSEDWLPACTHMATSDDDDQLMASSARAHTRTHDSAHEAWGLRDFLQAVSDADLVPDLLVDSTKVHTWTNGSEIGG